MITPNEALQFIKDHHNGEIPYTFGKNEYARWMAQFANHILTEQLHKPVVGGPASASVSEGEQLGNEAWGKAVCGDCGCKLTLVRPGKYQCDNIGCISNQ